MREIKFRAWHKGMQEMYDVAGWMQAEYHNSQKQDSVYCTDKYHVTQRYASDLVILQQYTGINDKNGVQICEGDIVRFEHEREYEIGSVVFGNHNGAFCFRLPHIGIRTPMLNFMSTMSLAATYDFEIIGNVYETPDLIGAEEIPQ